MPRETLRSHPDFQRAFVATAYFLGVRGEGLTAPLGSDGEEGRAFAERLAITDKQRRAETLAAEAGRVVRALEARGLR